MDVVGWSVGHLVGHLVPCLVGWLVGWLVVWLVSRLVPWLTGRSVCGSVGWSFKKKGILCYAVIVS